MTAFQQKKRAAFPCLQPSIVNSPLFGFTSTVVFVILAVAPSLGLLSSQRSLWIACIQLIIVAIWKLSDAQPQHPDPPETWYDVPSFPTPTSTSTDSSPEFNSSPPPPPENAAKETASSADDENDSMDTTWRAVMEGGGSSSSKPVLKKSSTWEKQQKVEVVAGQAVARPKMRKSKTFKEKSEGWRRRDVLVVGQDELFRRVETLIKKHHDHLQLQRQESRTRAKPRRQDRPCPLWSESRSSQLAGSMKSAKSQYRRYQSPMALAMVTLPMAVAIVNSLLPVAIVNSPRQPLGQHRC